MSNYTRSFGLLILLAFTLGGCASSPSASSSAHSPGSGKSVALSPQEEADRLFEILDVDGNGKISREEARSGFKYLIASYDRGGGTEILAAKPGETSEMAAKKKSKRRPTAQDANRAFEALFEKPTKASDGISKDEFKKLVVKASDNPDTDPFASFY